MIVETGSSGTQAGDITVDAPITMTAAGSALLSLLAANNIYLTANGDIVSTGGALSVILNSDRDQTAAGAVWLQSGSSILTNGGSLTIGGGANPATTAARASADILEGVRIEGASINTGGGCDLHSRGGRRHRRADQELGNCGDHGAFVERRYLDRRPGRRRSG